MAKRYSDLSQKLSQLIFRVNCPKNCPILIRKQNSKSAAKSVFYLFCDFLDTSTVPFYKYYRDKKMGQLDITRLFSMAWRCPTPSKKVSHVGQISTFVCNTFFSRGTVSQKVSHCCPTWDSWTVPKLSHCPIFSGTIRTKGE